MKSLVQELDQCRQGFKGDSRKASRQRVGSYQDDGANSRDVEFGTDADSMTQKDVSLELFDLVPRDYLVLERAETCRDSVCDRT